VQLGHALALGQQLAHCACAFCTVTSYKLPDKVDCSPANVKCTDMFRAIQRHELQSHLLGPIPDR
jgi:hypothetical protein